MLEPDSFQNLDIMAPPAEREVPLNVEETFHNTLASQLHRHFIQSMNTFASKMNTFNIQPKATPLKDLDG